MACCCQSAVGAMRFRRSRVAATACSANALLLRCWVTLDMTSPFRRRCARSNLGKWVRQVEAVAENVASAAMAYWMTGFAGSNGSPLVRSSVACADTGRSENTVSLCGHNGQIWVPRIHPFGAPEGRFFQLAADKGEQGGLDRQGGLGQWRVLRRDQAGGEIDRWFDRGGGDVLVPRHVREIALGQNGVPEPSFDGGEHHIEQVGFGDGLDHDVPLRENAIEQAAQYIGWRWQDQWQFADLLQRHGFSTRRALRACKVQALTEQHFTRETALLVVLENDGQIDGTRSDFIAQRKAVAGDESQGHFR